MTFASRIVPARVSHHRHLPKEHHFDYPVAVCVLDVDELPRLDHQVWGFGYNRPHLLSIFDGDYLAEGPGSLKDKLLTLLRNHGGVAVERIAKVFLATSARVMHRIFNPVSFWYCYDDAGKLVTCAAEVNNTFGDRHVYVLDAEGQQAPPYSFRTKKAMHVSPFFDMEGDYAFTMQDLREELDIGIQLQKAGATAFSASLTGEGPRLPFTTKGLLRLLLRHPLPGGLTMPRILKEAAALHFGKSLPAHKRPQPSHAMTIRHAPARKTIGSRAARAVLHRMFDRIEVGRLEIVDPDGQRRSFGQADATPARITITDPAFYTHVTKEGDIGLGEAWMDGHWHSDDLMAVFDIFLRNRKQLSMRHALGLPPWLLRSIHRLHGLRVRANDRSGSKANIHAHYDLSNDLFQAFLDPTITYSAGIFSDLENDTDLEAAQHRKLRYMLEKTETTPGEHILEIGCGWGSFALEAGASGRQVTGVTVSSQQLDLARRRVEEAGLEDRVDLQLRDYRDIEEGTYDGIVSIEMLEAVGHDFHADFFKTIDRLLKPGGKAVIQVITIGDAHYDANRISSDWIRKWIFPGGQLPSLGRISTVISQDTSLCLDHVEDIGPHYATTLRLWRERFQQNWPAIETLGFDLPFKRMWEYYLMLCEAGFAGRHIHDIQLVLTKPQQRGCLRRD